LKKNNIYIHINKLKQLAISEFDLVRSCITNIQVAIEK